MNSATVLLNPLLEGWAHRDEARRRPPMVPTLAFAAAYMSLWVRARADRQRLISTPPLTGRSPIWAPWSDWAH